MTNEQKTALRKKIKALQFDIDNMLDALKIDSADDGVAHAESLLDEASEIYDTFDDWFGGFI